MPKWFIRGVLVSVVAAVAADFIMDRLRPEPRERRFRARRVAVIGARG